MLKLKTGDGCRVTVVREETVMPLSFDVEGSPIVWGELDVITTTGCGIWRIRVRMWVERVGGSDGLVGGAVN